MYNINSLDKKKKKVKKFKDEKYWHNFGILETQIREETN